MNHKRATVSIQYGIGEGSWHGKLLRRALRDAGFKVVQGSEKADIILSHSAGCVFIRKPRPDQLLVLINPPYWPGKSLVVCTVRKILWDYRAFAQNGTRLGWLHKTFWNVVHLIRFILMLPKLALLGRRPLYADDLQASPILYIRNDQDVWSTPQPEKLFSPSANVYVVRHPGQHDDCWGNPLPYVQMIQSEADRIFSRREQSR